MPTDPYRVLGLPRDATLAEVKQAYRRLAKANHPDTAGQTAIPRFLEIQIAYEALVAGSPGRRARPRPGAAAPGEPWRADADRARAAREAYERARERPRRGTRPTGPGGAGGTTGAPPREPRSGKRATLGSTSYDGADQEPFDPDWSGATWYGTTSGTYWTLNPKEYADPRKHGPEYQARARRRAGATDAGATDAGATDGGSADGGSADAGAADEPTPASPGMSTSGSWADRAAGATPSAGRRPTFTTAPPPPPSRMPTDMTAGSGEPALFRFLDEARRSVSGRFLLALVGWVPIGIVLAEVLGESTGCIRYAAECQGPFGAATLIGQGSVVVLLLLVPRLAAVATLGTFAVLAAAIPAAALLSISGGARDPAGATSAFVVVLTVAWIAGVGFGSARTAFLAAEGRRPPVP